MAPADARYPAFRVDCLGVVAATYVETWETEQARPILEELVSYNRTTFGEKSFQYAHALGNLAMVEGFAQSFDLCFTHYLEVRDLLVPILGEKHLLIGDVYSSLSAFYTDAGRFEEGHKMGLLALDITQTLYGSDSPETITELNALGYNALCAENFAQANQYLSEAIAIGERALPANHPHLGNLYNLMCNLAARQGQLQDAIRWGEKSLKIHQSDPDQENDAAYSASMLAGIYLKLGKGESALPLAELAVQVARKRNDPVLYPLGEWLLKKGKALILVGQAAQAEICLREALDQMLALPEPPSEKVNEVLMHLKTVMTPERLAEWQALQNRAHALR